MAADPSFGCITLRYFNVAGCSADGALGEDHDPHLRIIPILMETALGRRDSFTVNGDDFAELRRLLPILKEDDDEDMHEWIDDGLMAEILTTALSNKIPVEDCHPAFNDRCQPWCHCGAFGVAYVCTGCSKNFCQKCRLQVAELSFDFTIA